MSYAPKKGQTLTQDQRCSLVFRYGVVEFLQDFCEAFQLPGAAAALIDSDIESEFLVSVRK